MMTDDIRELTEKTAGLRELAEAQAELKARLEAELAHEHEHDRRQHILDRVDDLTFDLARRHVAAFAEMAASEGAREYSLSSGNDLTAALTGLIYELNHLPTLLSIAPADGEEFMFHRPEGASYQNASEELDRRVRELRMADPSLDYQQAMSEALRRDPMLAAQYAKVQDNG